LKIYIPTLHSRDKLIEACEAIERSEIAVERPSREESSQNHRNIKRSAIKNNTEPHKKQKSDCKHYCSEQGYNPTHATADCYTIKNRTKATNHVSRATNAVFPTRISAKRSICKPRHHLKRRFWRCMPLSSRENKPSKMAARSQKTPENCGTQE
jgi:hypothetical protein